MSNASGSMREKIAFVITFSADHTSESYHIPCVSVHVRILKYRVRGKCIGNFILAHLGNGLQSCTVLNPDSNVICSNVK